MVMPLVLNLVSKRGLMTILLPKSLVAGNDIFDTYPYVDQINDEIIKDSLVIILDTANKERI